jgi:N-acetylneuraminic acid mutarotase
MIRKSILIALLTVTMVFPAKAWIQRDTIGGGPRSAANGFCIGTAAYVALGLDSNSFKRSMWMYNPATDLWTQMESFGGPTGQGLDRDVAMSFAIGNKAWIVGGQGSNPYFNDTWEYDAVTDSWSQKQNFPAGGRRSGVGFAANGKGYVGLGQSSTGLRNDMWEYNPTLNTWIQKANFPGTSRRLAACFVINNKAYIGTGDDGAFKQDMYEFDPATNLWTAKANFGGTPRYGTVSFTLFGKGYIGLGYDNTLQNTDDIWEYNPATNSWIFKDNFPGSKRSNATAVVTPNNKCYIGLGYDSLLRDDWWEFDPIIDGISEQEYFASLISMYPNPAFDYVVLDIPSTLIGYAESAQLTIVDLGGRTVYTQSVNGPGQQRIATTDLAHGVYHLLLATEAHGTITKQLIVR